MMVGILEKLPRRKVEPPTPDTNLLMICTTIKTLSTISSNIHP